jgi:hypothetical protein
MTGAGRATPAAPGQTGGLTLGTALAIVFGLLLTQAVVLLLMGREPICTCGSVKFWYGTVKSAENSQHLTDWYSFTHIIHGFLFYGALTLIAPRMPVLWRLVFALAVEGGWEILENTDFVINRYRTETISLDYYGDSVVNSLMDSIAMMAGFVLAARPPIWVTVAIAVGIEAGLAVMIRDNLTLNVIMLLHPFDAVKTWQAGA